MFEPSYHKPIPMNSRVIVPPMYLGKPATGTVVGVASMHVIFHYIVLLDEEMERDFGVIKAITVPGPELNGLNGEHWRLES